MGVTKLSANSIKWYLKSEVGLDFIPEHKFHPKRKWKFDLACLDKKIAVEIEGGIFQNKNHGSISGILRDVEKYNEALGEGWKVIRVVPSKTELHYIAKLIKRILVYDS